MLSRDIRLKPCRMRASPSAVSVTCECVASGCKICNSPSVVTLSDSEVCGDSGGDEWMRPRVSFHTSPTLHATRGRVRLALRSRGGMVASQWARCPRSALSPLWSHVQSAADLTFSLRLLRSDEPIDRTEVRARGGDDDVGRGPRATVLDGLDRSAHAILRLVHRHARAAREVEWQRGT